MKGQRDGEWPLRRTIGIPSGIVLYLMNGGLVPLLVLLLGSPVRQFACFSNNFQTHNHQSIVLMSSLDSHSLAVLMSTQVSFIYIFQERRTQSVRN